MENQILSSLGQEPSLPLTNYTPYLLHPYISLLMQSKTFELRKTQIKQLLRVFLFFSTYSGPHDKALLKLCDNYPRNFRWLKYLTIGVSSFTKLTSDQIIRASSKCLRLIKSLKHLKLMAYTLNQASFLASFLKNLKQVQHLTLDYCYCKFSEKPPVYKFFCSLKSLRSLRDLKVIFTGTPGIPSQVVKELCAGTSHLKTLETISFDFNESSLDLSAGDKTAFLFNFKRFNSLSALTLKFSNAQGMNDQILENIARSLQQIPRLEKFELILTYCREITNKGIKTLSSCLPSGLKSFRIDVENCFNVNREGIERLFSSIAKMNSLNCLSLSSSFENRINNEGMIELARCLENLNSLSSLRLTFYSCNVNFTQASLIQFLTFLGSKKSLRNLTLRFPSCSKIITDDLMGVFGDLLVGLKELENFGLNFNSCSELTDKGIEELAMKIGTLEKVQRLNLEFGRCNGVVGGSVEKLIKSLKNLKKLRSAIVELRGSKNLNKEEVKKALESQNSLKFKLTVHYK